MNRPICKFCSENHRTDTCQPRLISRCLNCRGPHLAYSRECEVYMYEFEVMRYSFWDNCGYEEVDQRLREMNLIRPGGCRSASPSPSSPSSNSPPTLDRDDVKTDSPNRPGSVYPIHESLREAAINFLLATQERNLQVSEALAELDIKQHSEQI